jgi:hypothetical protein
LDKKPIGGSADSLKEIMLPFATAIQENIERMRPALGAIANAVEIFIQQCAPLVKQFTETYWPKIEEFAKGVRKWQEDQKISVAGMAKQGWFPNWFTFFSQIGDKSLDDFMIDHIDQCLDILKQKIVEFSPERKHILEAAFRLHEEGNYIASIPLLLTQSDGICSERFTYFFTKDPSTGNKASDEIIQQSERGEFAASFFTEIMLEPFKVKLQICEGASKASKKAKAKGPNRHGILHGSRKHLDYGTKINGYKALSFLAFIVFTVKDVLKKT